MVEALLTDPLDSPGWDDFVARHPFGWVCHLSAWTTALENSFKHIKGHLVVLRFGPKGPIRAALPVYEVRSWLTGNRLVSVPFATLSDPLVSSDEEFQGLLEGTKRLAETLRIGRIEIRAHLASVLLRTNEIAATSAYRCHMLPLDADLDRLRRTFHRTCVRQRISRALKSDLELVVAESESDLQDFYSLYILARRRLALPPLPFAFFQSLWNALSNNGTVSILLAKKEGVPVAGLLLLKFRGRVSAEVLATDIRYRAASPAHFLFWHAIWMAASAGCRCFDFGRTHADNTQLMDFKRRWGTQVVDLPIYHFPETKAQRIRSNESSIPYRIVRQACRAAPDFAFKQIGEFCYRHLG